MTTVAECRRLLRELAAEEYVRERVEAAPPLDPASPIVARVATIVGGAAA